MTVRPSPFHVSALVALSVGIATVLPVTAPRGFDRVVRSTRGGLQRSESCDAVQGQADHHAEALVVAAAQGPNLTTVARSAPARAAIGVTSQRLHPPISIGTAHQATDHRHLTRRHWLAPVGRAPPHA
jgi:hypothetical protein